MKASVLTSLCLAGALVGCNTGNGTTSDQRSDSNVIKPLAETQPQINIVAPNREVATGDTVTLTVSSRNTLGRNARIEWNTTGGKVNPEENGASRAFSSISPARTPSTPSCTWKTTLWTRTP